MSSRRGFLKSLLAAPLAVSALKVEKKAKKQKIEKVEEQEKEPEVKWYEVKGTKTTLKEGIWSVRYRFKTHGGLMVHDKPAQFWVRENRTLEIDARIQREFYAHRFDGDGQQKRTEESLFIVKVG